MKVIRTIIIDDEKLARELIISYLENHNNIEVISQCANGFEGLKAIQEMRPDLVFLDIKMPKITGFEMLELLDNAPFIIFSTAYDEYAIKAFEMNAVDYLLKPYTKDRFDKALSKAITQLISTDEQYVDHSNLIKSVQNQNELLDRIVVKVHNRIHIIATSSIQYIEAMDDYIRIHTPDGHYLKQQTMKYLETHLDPNSYVRIHRSYIVAVGEILKLEMMEKESYVVILKDNTQLPVSRSGYSRLKNVLNF